MPQSPNTETHWAYESTDPQAKLRKLPCEIRVQNARYGGSTSSTSAFYLNSLPELTWRKEAAYNTQSIIGRASPVVSYSSSKSKTIEITLHMHGPTYADMVDNLRATHFLASALHPRYEGTYAPPPICTLACGRAAKRSATTSPFAYLRFIMTSMNQTFSSEGVWDEDLMVPRMWDLQISGEVIYNYMNLPGAAMVLNGNW